jgi:Na+:H+ antiporter, NhaA family
MATDNQNSFFARLTGKERNRVSDFLREETVGGVLLLIAATVAIVWANSPWGDFYKDLAATKVGFEAIGLKMSLSHWAADLLLALFFLVVGFELKHEFLYGSLSDPAKAVVPIAAAIGGMLFPAAIYVSANIFMDGDFSFAWGVPIATDIAFALAVLAVFGKHLPVELRAFLLTLAVVDDLGAITVIAVFYSKGFYAGYFLLTLALLALYGIAQKLQWRSLWFYVPVGLGAWTAMYLSGVHATVAGVALGLLTSATKKNGEAKSPLDKASHVLHPWSAGLAVPIFAFFAAGVDLRGIAFADNLSSPIFIGIVLGLVVGKPLGVLLVAWLLARFTRAELAEEIDWRDVGAVGVLAGIGFTVSLLIAELAFTADASLANTAKVGVLSASAVATVLAIGVLQLSRKRNTKATTKSRK